MKIKQKVKQRWPTKKVMQQIYELHLWGGEDVDFYSGAGSHDVEIVGPYVQAVVSFLKTFEKPPMIVDLGCGDFNIGKEFVQFAQRYLACDIVPELIERNKAKYVSDNLAFLCIDIAREELPDGEVVILRQVLQHLSNDEVKQVVDKLGQYRFIILTEHVPSGEFEPNLDILSGQGIRLKRKSGLDLFHEPFNLNCTQHELMVTHVCHDGKGIIKTWLIESY